MLNRQRGYSLVELAIGIGIVGIIMAAALPNFRDALKNSRVKASVESYQTGMQLARAEALRRNSQVRFNLVSDLTGACTVTGSVIGGTSAPSWVVSLDDPTGLCNLDPSDVVAPRIIQKWDARETAGSAMPWFITITTVNGPLTFNGLGRVSSPLPMAGPSPGVAEYRFDLLAVGIDNVHYTCTYMNPALGTTRCLRIKVNGGGQIRMCDPNVTVATDPRFC